MKHEETTVPERGKVMLTLGDLGVLACIADRNGTTSAFVTVAMQWASEAQEEIERLRIALARAAPAMHSYASKNPQAPQPE